MAVALLAEIPGISPDQYDQLNNEMNFPDEVPDGLIAHVAGPTDGGMQIVDVWESREHFDRFIQDTLMPAWQSLGIPAAGPDPREVPIHNLFQRR